MAKGKAPEDTPLIKQFFSVKAQHPEAVLLYRVGDFYESYSDDAVLVSKVLGIIQTKKSNGDKGYVEMAGFPSVTNSKIRSLPRNSSSVE